MTSVSTERLKILPGASPTLRRDFIRFLVLIALLPVTWKLSIDGRSITTTIRVFPRRRISMSRKKPVAYSASIARRILAGVS